VSTVLAVVLVVVGFLAVILLVLLGLRRATFDEVRAEAALHQPGSHTVTYVVPNGQDASVLLTALMHAGFKAVGGMEHGEEHVIVACTERERAEVRRIIESVHEANFGGPEIRVPPVRFVDER
jgi:hypothetical protein